MDAGADVCVTSVHKMGGGLEQGSVFHQQGDRVDHNHLASCADLLDTTSPNVLLYAAMDGWRRQMAQHGNTLLADALVLASHVRERIEAIAGLHVDCDEFLGPDRAFEVDPLQLVIDVGALGITGYAAADWLRMHHRVSLHVCDHRRVSAQLSYADDRATADALVTALQALPAHAQGLRRASAVVDVPSPTDLRLETVMLPRDAFFADTEHVDTDRAEGRVAAEMLTPYPPGIPVVVPGERLSKPVLSYLRSGVAAGMVVPDADDPSLRVVRVVAGT